MITNNNDVLAFQTRRVFNVIAKRFLILMEDLRQDHDINFDKLKDSLPECESLLSQADYFDERKFAHLRKKILDIVNDGFRELDEELKKYDMELK